MRYQLPVYPSLALIAAWGISALWNGGYTRIKILSWLNKGKLYQWLTIIVSAGVLLSTAAWAFAFTRIYTEPVTRVAATEWVYQNIPAAFNLKIDTEEGQYNLPVAYQLGTRISHSQPMIIAFRPKAAGIVNKIQITHIADRANRSSSVKVLIGVISEDAKEDLPLANAVVSDAFLAEADDERGKSYDLVFMQPPYLEVGNTYYLTLATTSDELPLDVYGQIILYLSSYDGSRVQSLGQPVRALKPGETYSTTFRSPKGGSIRTIYLPRVIDWQADPSKKRIKVEISGETEGTAVLESDFDPFVNPMESGFWLSLDHPVEVKPDTIYVFRLTYESGDGIIAVYGSQITRESTWDDVVPMGMDGLDAWDYNHGLYQSDLNFEMYWDDTTAKLDRFQSILDQADTIIITSNRQYGTTVRVPERYPLTSAFYRNLLGCPADESIITCYYQAEPGMYNGSLGYQLVQVFQSEPRLGQWTFNTQFAEEAFTVYDHPKVLIFRKQADYNPESVREILSSVDLSLVVNVTPGKVKSYPANIQLPDERFQQQISGGTWSQYFNQTFIYNRYPILALILWYFAVSVLGWVVYPMVRLAFRGLADRGMTFIRMAGLLLLAYPVWVAGSIGVPFTRNTIFLAFFLLALINLGLFWTRKNEILEELRSRKKQIILIEILALLFFTFFLMIRLGNPDLWHQYKGGEKPMDFSYFNAVLKSTSFPPYDPWFAGGYINYYYYGFVLVGVPVKALGIMPSVAFNLILPTFFSLYAMGAFGIGWNLLANGNHETRKDMSSSTDTDVADEQVFEPSEKKVSRKKRLISDWLPMIQEKTFIAGIAASVFALIVGNLGTIRMIWHGLIRLVVSGEQLEQAGAIQLWLWSFQGLGKFLSGVPLPYGLGDWYWIPSRAIPGEPITEFPFFTFLYADPHAHLYALPVTLFVLGWCLAVLKQRCALNKPFWFEGLLSIFIGSLAVGSLRAINTWDMPTFLLLSVFVIGYTIFRYYQNISQSPSRLRALVVTLIAIVVFVGLSFFLYRPYTQWYAPGYQSIEIWNGGHTPFWSYITHWGLYLFFILSWLVRETIDWMAKTPLSSVRKLRPYRGLIAIMVVGLIVSILYLVKRGVSISWFVLPLAVWAGILILRPNQPDLKRFVLFCVGTALVLTLAVELIVLKGDIGRMNTVFKFYLQAWSLFSISAAVSFVWLIHPLLSAPRKKNLSGWQNAWLGAGMVLLAGALMFPIMGGSAKIRDRMAPEAPHTLDGMAYMQYAYYYDQDTVFDLSQDYQAIRWMQDHVIGSPVIVEGNTPEYRWGSRFTIYTGLPGVVGWNWHQRQQRALTPSSWVTDRIYDIEQFYTTTDRYLTEVFLKKYKVNYIVVGQLEKAYYPGMGLEKFEDWNGDLWTEVYRYKDTVIYEVIKE